MYLSLCLLLWKHIQILDIFPEAASESHPPPPPPSYKTGGNAKGIVSLNSAFENAISQSSTFYEK